RREGDDVDLLGDVVADRLDLVFLLLLRVGEFEVDAGRGGGLFDRRRVGRAPAGFRPHLREAQGDGLLAAGAGRVAAGRLLAAGRQCAAGDDEAGGAGGA